MKKVLKSLTIFSLIFVILTSFVGCSSKVNNSAQNKQDNNQQKVVEDQKNTDNLKKNKGVLDGKVYTQNGWAIATILIKDDISDKEAKELADEYAKKLKKQYGNMKVNVQAVKNGKSIANIKIE